METLIFASNLGLHCLPLSHKKDARLIWVNLIMGKNVDINFVLFDLIVYVPSTIFQL